MRRFIDADEAKGKFSDALPIGRSIRQTIDEIPTADVVEVVRCAECKHHDEYYPVKRIGEEASIVYECRIDRKAVPATHYCSYGERREQ